MTSPHIRVLLTGPIGVHESAAMFKLAELLAIKPSFVFSELLGHGMLRAHVNSVVTVNAARMIVKDVDALSVLDDREVYRDLLYKFRHGQYHWVIFYKDPMKAGSIVKGTLNDVVDFALQIDDLAEIRPVEPTEE